MPGRWFILFSALLPQQLEQGRLDRAARLSPSCASLGRRFHRALPSIPDSIPCARGTDGPRGFSEAHSKGVQRGVMDGSDRAQTPEGGNKTGRDTRRQHRELELSGNGSPGIPRAGSRPLGGDPSCTSHSSQEEEEAEHVGIDGSSTAPSSGVGGWKSANIGFPFLPRWDQSQLLCFPGQLIRQWQLIG